MKSTFYVLCAIVFAFLMYRNFLIAQTPIKNIKSQMEKEPGIVVDVRTQGEWNTGHYPTAIWADWNAGDVQKQAGSWDKSKTYYLYCASGVRSGNATEFLKKNGFSKVYNLGGYSNLIKK